jgi:hypothetical protein
MFVQVLVPEDDCFIAAMLTAASVLEGIPKENPSNEEKRIWCAVNAPVINQFRQGMACVIFTIHTVSTEHGEEKPSTSFSATTTSTRIVGERFLLKMNITTHGSLARGGVTLNSLP